MKRVVKSAKKNRRTPSAPINLRKCSFAQLKEELKRRSSIRMEKEQPSNMGAAVNYVSNAKPFTSENAVSPEGPEKPTLLDRFFVEVKGALTHRAANKGYSRGNVQEYDNPLMDFVEKTFPGHALGEIVYKATQFQKDIRGPYDHRNLDRLVKIAAWAAIKHMQLVDKMERDRMIQETREDLQEFRRVRSVLNKPLEVGYDPGQQEINSGKFNPGMLGKKKR